MRSRSNLLVLLGIAFFVVGGIIVYVLTSDDDDGAGAAGSGPSPWSSPPRTSPPAASPTTSSPRAALKETEVPAGAAPAGAIQSLNQLEGATFIQGFAADQQITSAGAASLQPRPTRCPRASRPSPCSSTSSPACAGYVNPGDRINLYGVFGTAVPGRGRDAPRRRAARSPTSRCSTSNLTIPARRRASGDAAVPRPAASDVGLPPRRPDRRRREGRLHHRVRGLYATLVADDAAARRSHPGPCRRHHPRRRAQRRRGLRRDR